ncbi:MAG: hypothetical protein IIU71_01475 [Selenomonadaceae bacterium]|nr:hypothetical protein [Selenomonadaceae bacterium]
MPAYINTPYPGACKKEKPKSRLRVCERGRRGGFLQQIWRTQALSACECPEKRVSLAMLDGNKEALGDDVDEFFSGHYR